MVYVVSRTWKAAKAASKTMPNLDETGMVIGGCRHVIAQKAVNMFRGEIYGYPHYLHQEVFACRGVRWLWEDVICQYWPWARSKSPLFINSRAMEMKPALSVMHAKAHSWHCQIFDRLLASIGQDTLDTVYWVATETKSKKRDYLEVMFYFGVANIYVFLHTVLALFQAVTLNVAMNSHSNVLLTILISNQFVELKGNVFKKFETDNLFQMSCSDIRERFHLLILLMIVSVRNLAAFNWNMSHLETLFPVVLMVVCSEMFVDWVKHAFITKFNDIQPEVYRKYRSILAKDLAISRYKNSRGDHSDLVSRRVGFIPLPLVCLVWHTFSKSFHIHGNTGILMMISLFIFLISLKVLNGVLLLGMVHGYQHYEPAADTYVSSNPTTGQQLKLSKSLSRDVSSLTTFHTSQDSLRNTDSLLENIPVSFSTGEAKDAVFLKQKNHRPKTPLAEIERYALCSNRIV